MEPNICATMRSILPRRPFKSSRYRASGQRSSSALLNESAAYFNTASVPAPFNASIETTSDWRVPFDPGATIRRLTPTCQVHQHLL